MSHIHSILTSPFPSKSTKFRNNLPVPLLPQKFTKFRKIKRTVPIVLQAASSENPSPLIAKIDVPPNQSHSLISASEVVKKFYDGINRRDLGAVENLIALDCVYEDLIFPTPFVGRKSILEFFEKFIDYISSELQFVIDAISEEDSSAIGVTWHLEWKGKAFPFSKGCSFYKLTVVNAARQIMYARDSVEPAIKPGESALVAIRGVTWLLQRFPNLVDML